MTTTRTSRIDGTWAKIVHVGRANVLEMRDCNSGQGSDPATKLRHQYVLAGGQLWRRRLPPESVGDEWADKPGPVAWERMDVPRYDSAITDYAETAHGVGVAVVRRLEMQDSYRDTLYRVRGEDVSADETEDVELLAGPVTGAWWEVPLPPCPDCGGDLVWWEAGWVPGTRKCLGQPIGQRDGRPTYDTAAGCGSLYTVAVAQEAAAPAGGPASR